LNTPNKNKNNKIYNANNKQIKSITPTNVVVNLSNKKLSLVEIAVLNKGLNFSISNNNNSRAMVDYQSQINDFIKKLQLQYIFQHKENNSKHKFTGNTLWMPAPHKCSPIFIGYGDYLINQPKTLLKKIKTKPNISKKERSTLIDPKRDKDIIIQKADKGGGIVVIESLVNI